MTQRLWEISQLPTDIIREKFGIPGIPAQITTPETLPASITENNQYNGGDVTVNMGGITMNGVNDPQEFADQIVYSVQKYPKVQKAVRSIGVDRLAGSGRLSVNNIR